LVTLQKLKRLQKENLYQASPNPSHLEAVNPVVAGFTRAKADTLYSSEYDSILPILIHGDAALPDKEWCMNVCR
jgi:2-oxoglutarate dehydrogenase complex dehydrogenase (E1) component-like enzyme